MHVFADPFFVEKAGNKNTEYEDAFWPVREIASSVSSLKMAVADGATEASFSKIWANQLVKSFGKGELHAKTFWEDLKRQQRVWARVVGRKPLPWYAEEKVKSGAFAAFLALEIHEHLETNQIVWRVFGLGDCCLFQVRGGKTITSFPFNSSAAFNNCPLLIPSIQSLPDELSLFKKNGSALTDDTFFLMTDAIACWTLKELENGNSPWLKLMDLNTDADGGSFAAFISNLRQEKKLKNDDVTILRLTIGV